MISISFPDGAIRKYDNETTCIAIAESISSAFAKKCLAAKVDGKLVDMSFFLNNDCSVKFITSDVKSDDKNCTEEYNDALEIIRHDAAHLLAQAVKELYPAVQITIGPVIENGFYYDIASDVPFNEGDLEKLEDRMKDISNKKYAIEREIWQRNVAIDFFKNLGENYKAEIISDLPESEEISLYRQGDFIDLCRGPHAPSTGFVKHFKLLKVSGSYWRGDSKNASLQRIYGTAWLTKEDLDSYLLMLKESAKRDHRKIGKEMGLFHQQEEAAGDVFWHPHGYSLFLAIQSYIREKLSKNYLEVKTPQLMRRNLWENSGHWEKFRENMFTSVIDETEYAIKPMNCPGHVQIFSNRLHSYRDLPIRMAEFGCCHRYEPSGALHGIMRVRSFTQDDAHIFCTEEQITSETIEFCRLLSEVYADFGFHDFFIKFSDRPEKRAGDDAIWDKAESCLLEAIKATGRDYVLNKGEGAFYGPKLEFVLRDAVGRDWQCGTLQVDFVLPSRLGAEYIESDGSKRHPVMLHRAILGSIERFIGVLIEHYAGAFPNWLAPVQLGICGVSNKHDSIVNALAFTLKNNLAVRLDVDIGSDTVAKKVLKFANAKVPYVLLIGDREAETLIFLTQQELTQNTGSSVKMPEDIRQKLESTQICLRLRDGTKKEVTIGEFIKLLARV